MGGPAAGGEALRIYIYIPVEARKTGKRRRELFCMISKIRRSLQNFELKKPMCSPVCCAPCSVLCARCSVLGSIGPGFVLLSGPVPKNNWRIFLKPLIKLAIYYIYIYMHIYIYIIIWYVFLWFSLGFPLVLLKLSHGVPVVSLAFSVAFLGFSIGLLEVFLKIPSGFPLCFLWPPKVFPWLSCGFYTGVASVCLWFPGIFF